MLTRFKKHCSNPITWGAYYKLCGISLLASVAMGVALSAKTMYDLKQYRKQFCSDEEIEEEES